MGQQLHAGGMIASPLVPKARAAARDPEESICAAALAVGGACSALALLSTLAGSAHAALARLRLDGIAPALARQFAIASIALT
jgi:hypothetical protein